MEEREKKQGLSLLKPASDAQFEGYDDPMPCTQTVRGSNLLVSTMHPPVRCRFARLPLPLSSAPLLG
jgi:hypothetical protein